MREKVALGERLATEIETRLFSSQQNPLIGGYYFCMRRDRLETVKKIWKGGTDAAITLFRLFHFHHNIGIILGKCLSRTAKPVVES
jgi:hypothetical protein